MFQKTIDTKEVILVSGPPGCGRDEYIQKVIDDEQTEYYHVYDYIVEAGKEDGKKVTKINILQLQDLPKYRKKAFEKIRKEIENSDKKYHIISTPAVFYHLDDTRINGLTEELLCTIKPDVIIAFIDDLIEMKKRLKEDEYWGEAFGSEGAPLDFLSRWRWESITFLRSMYDQHYLPRGEKTEEIFVKEMYIYARRHDESVLRRLIYERKLIPKLYLSYHITDIKKLENEEIKKKLLSRIEEFKKKLSEEFIVFDPYTIRDWDIVDTYDAAVRENKEKIDLDGLTLDIKEIERAVDSIRMQIIKRDLWMIDTADAVVVYHLSNTASAGVMTEIVHADSKRKPVFGIFPYKVRPSPFLEYFMSWGSIQTWVRGEKNGPEELTDEELEDLENKLIEKLNRLKEHFFTSL